MHIFDRLLVPVLDSFRLDLEQCTQASASERKNKQSQVAVAEYHTWVTAVEKNENKIL
jgi:hypothetical protein